MEKQVRETTHDNVYSVESVVFNSEYLDRNINIDLYVPNDRSSNIEYSLLLVNDGQDLPRMPFLPILNNLAGLKIIKPLIVVGLHCNEDRRLEYGTADELDYMHRGSRAKYYRKFILKELLPFLHQRFELKSTASCGFAGFSLGGLGAMDIAWKHPEVFNIVGVFSGSFWWRAKALDHGYEEDKDRIMHVLIRKGKFAPGMRFFFQTGQLDETMDRNNNGIIDSIDDTLDLISELKMKGYREGADIRYYEMPLGTHDVPTWAKAFPEFLSWSFGNQ